MNILETIIKAKFLADEKQVESLAGIVGDGINASGTYLSVIVAHTQTAMTGKRKPSIDTQLGIVDKVHDRFYPAVLSGLRGERGELSDEEINRRGIFARTAASDLRHFIRQGGDVRSLEAATVSKAKLRAEGKVVPTGTRTERSLTKAADAWTRAIQRLAKRSLDEARQRIIEQQAVLEELLEQLGRPAPARKAKHGRRAGRKPASTGRRPAEERAPH